MNQEAQLNKDIRTLTEICNRYGWSISIGPEDANGNIMGMVLGTDEYIHEVLDEEIFEKEGDDN